MFKHIFIKFLYIFIEICIILLSNTSIFIFIYLKLYCQYLSIKYKFPGRKPIIKISTKNDDDSIILTINDNGLGIDLVRHKSNLFKIRKVFHDHPDAKGFGLYISKKQIDALGGRIWIESTPNIGSTFFIEFINQKNN